MENDSEVWLEVTADPLHVPVTDPTTLPKRFAVCRPSASPTANCVSAELYDAPAAGGVTVAIPPGSTALSTAMVVPAEKFAVLTETPDMTEMVGISFAHSKNGVMRLVLMLVGVVEAVDELDVRFLTIA